jgi:hypothetical protein
MNTRYLEISSAYRDRTQFPLPSDFVVLISQTGTKNQIQAVDPVSTASPLDIFSIADFDQVTKNITVSGVVSPAPSGYNNTASQFVVSILTGVAHHEEDYYTGSVIFVNAVSTRITFWSYIGNTGANDFFLLTVESALSNVPVNPNTIVINNASNLALSTPNVFFPTGFTIDEFYNDYILYNQTRNEYRNIISYDGAAKIAVLTSATPTWANTDILVIRLVIPQEVGIATNTTSTSFAVLDPTRSSVIPGFYVGDFIRVTGGPALNEMRRITAYTGNVGITPYQITISPPFDVLPFAAPVLPATTNYEILQFSRDNLVPFNYTGSTVSQQDMVCYELELVNLILPNITLKSGGKIAFYPYVYVEFQNISSAGAGLTSAIYSNNPNAVKKMFRATIDDIRDPIISPYIRIDGDGMVQTVKFKPNDNLKFGVYLSDGRPFETQQIDNISPLPPNPLVQISALISMKRVS